MYIEISNNNGTKYLRLVQSKRVPNKDGVKMPKKTVVFNIGPLSRFDDGKPDYLRRLKDSFKAGSPIIPSLQPYAEQAKAPRKKVTVTFEQGTESCVAHPKKAAPIVLDALFQELGLDRLCASIKHAEGLSFDLAGFLRLLLFGRILSPASKMATVRQSADYFAPPVDPSADPFRVYDLLDVLAAHRKQFVACMNASIGRRIGRSTTKLFYDVTNFYFEIERADEDEEVDGEMVKGLRQRGVSKENRKQPIVQMGLFLDTNGIPVTAEAFPGNTLDQATLRPALRKSLAGLDFERYVLVADRGMCSVKNACALVDDGQGYLVSKSIRKTAAEERAWILSEEGYVRQGEGFRYKSRIVTRRGKDEHGKMRELREQVVVYWSRRFYERERHEHESFLAFLEKLEKSPSSFRVTRRDIGKLSHFLKKDVVNKETGEITDSRKLLSFIDEEKVEEFTRSMGYYQIVTSELSMPPLDVIDTYHGLSRIEDQFRVMKGVLEARPVFVRTREHIEAHLLVCLMALVMLRLLERRIALGNGMHAEGRNWSYGMSCERVQAALNKWMIEDLPEANYRFCNTDDEDLEKILRAVGLKNEARIFSCGDIWQMKSKVSVMV